MVLRSLKNLWTKAVAAFTFPNSRSFVTLPGADHEQREVFVATKRKVKEFEYQFAHLLVDYSGLFGVVQNAPTDLPRHSSIKSMVLAVRHPSRHT